MKLIKSALLVYASLLLLAFSSYSSAANRTWSGSVSSNWYELQNWAEGSVPDQNDSVIIDGIVTHQPVIDLSEGPVTIASLSIGATKVSTLTFTFGDVDAKKLIVTGNVYVGPNGTLTHAVNANEETHRLFLDVGGDMEIANKGFINADKKGFSSGPDGTGIGRSHGGHGGVTALVYGSMTHPINIGSSYTGNGGGGAIKLHVTGTLLVNGTISSSSPRRGTGGSVLIDADTIAGTTGIIQANGADSCGGGRIALYYNSKTFTGTITANSAIYMGLTGAGGTIFEKNKNENNGKLRVSNSVTSQNFTYLVNPNIAGETLHLQSITAHDRARIFVGVNITADNYITEGTGLIKKWTDTDMLGTDPDTWWIGTVDTNWYNGANWSSGNVPGPDAVAVVEGGHTYFPNRPYLFIEDKNEKIKSLGVGNSILHLNCPFDEENNWRLILSEDLILAPGGLIAHNTNTGSAENFRVNIEAENMNIAFSGGVELSAKGRTKGGPGGPNQYMSSYGGQSPNSPVTYGSITWPINLGSTYTSPGSGGAGKLAISGVANIDGFIKSHGQKGTGGSILLLCDTFSGSGECEAGSNSGSGGRIAIYYREKEFAGSISANGANYLDNSAAGTIFEKPDHLEHGILIIRNEVVNTSIFTSLNDLEAVNYTFDEILISGTGRLLVGSDDSLTLPENGLMIIEENNQASVTVAENGIFNNAGTIELPGIANSLNIVGNLNNFPGSLVRYTGVSALGQDSYVMNGFDYYNLEIDAPGKSFLWNAGETYNINGQLSIFGEPDEHVVLRSTIDEEQCFLNLTGMPGYAEHVDVKDSNAGLGKYVLVGPKENQGWNSSIDSGNNVNWFFGLYMGTVFVFY